MFVFIYLINSWTAILAERSSLKLGSDEKEFDN